MADKHFHKTPDLEWDGMGCDGLGANVFAWQHLRREGERGSGKDQALSQDEALSQDFFLLYLPTALEIN